VLWETERARAPLDTPERRADFRVRLRAHINHIGDRDVRRFYAEDFRAREAKLFEAPAAVQAPARGGGRGWRRPVDPAERLRKDRPAGMRHSARRIGRLEARLLLVTLIQHPLLVDEFHEALAAISLADEALDRLRAEIVHTLAAGPGLDSAGLQNYLAARGFSMTLGDLLRPDVHNRVRNGRRNLSVEDARAWLEGTLAAGSSRLLPEELLAAQQRYVDASTPEAWEQFCALMRERETEPGSEDDGIDGERRKRS
jgi:DNA primase